MNLRILQVIVRVVQRRASLLLPILRSAFQGELLAWLYLHPDDEFTLTELAARFDMSHATVSREADRLVEASLVTDRRMGNLRLIRANLDTVVARPLTDLLVVTYGPIVVLSDLLAGVSGVEEAFVYGSWAARYRGQPGPVPKDVDVLVVGAADEDELDEVARTAERILGREVNVRVVPSKLWRKPAGDPFIATVRSRPLVAIAHEDRGAP